MGAYIYPIKFIRSKKVHIYIIYSFSYHVGGVNPAVVTMLQM